MTLWGSRFGAPLDPRVREFTASLEVDKRLASYDVRGSLAHARMLRRQRVIPTPDADRIIAGLERIARAIDDGSFAWPADAEDVHSAVEVALYLDIGDVAGALHTARSRNDQVALALRLFTLDAIDSVDAAVDGLQSALLETARSHVETVMPGYTHLQRAQPISLAHHLLAHVEALDRDRARLGEARARTAVS
ncbi:MAG TPA: lyase family protein, partial [Candidatus Limnocylindria bacterium]|nr:lyase family protein [Candidatus Limnocylindria bacterium]